MNLPCLVKVTTTLQNLVVDNMERFQPTIVTYGGRNKEGVVLHFTLNIAFEINESPQEVRRPKKYCTLAISIGWNKY